MIPQINRHSYRAETRVELNSLYALNKQVPRQFNKVKILLDRPIAADVKNLEYGSSVSASESTGGAIPTKTVDGIQLYKVSEQYEAIPTYHYAREKSRIKRYTGASGHFFAVGSLHTGWYMMIYLNEEVAHDLGDFPFYTDAEEYRSLRMLLRGKTRNTEVSWISIQKDSGDLVYGMLLDTEKYHRPVLQSLKSCRVINSHEPSKNVGMALIQICL